MKSLKLWIEMFLIGLLLFAQAAAAQNKPASSEKAATTVGTAPTQVETPAGPHEGIQVHGHWTVIVRNADGSVASRQEFENSLTNEGKGFTLGALVGDTFPIRSYPPSWTLKISGSLCNHFPGPTLGDCVVAVKGQRKTGGKLEFTGTVKMDAAGQIMSVATVVGDSGSSGGITFSSRDLTQPDTSSGQTPAPINVQPGQNVDFTVDISIL